MVLRCGIPGEFQLLASDPFGRPLWILSRLRGESWLVDHRAEAFCRAREGVSVPELELSGLEVDRVPDILEGRLPVELPAAGASEPFYDAAGRQWSARVADGGVTGWTLWGEAGPLLWWSRQERGGILSHRRGSQFRWRGALAEEVPAGRFAVTIPEGYDRLACAAWNLPQLRQDQSPSAGGGPPR